jgi:hypothetical protein
MPSQVTPLFTRAELEARVSRLVLDRIFDDDETGTATTEAINRLIDDSSGTVWAYLPNEAQDTILANDVPSYLKKLALDVAQGTLALRHPEATQLDGECIMKNARLDLKAYVEQWTKVKQVDRPDTFGSVASSSVASGETDPGWVR